MRDSMVFYRSFLEALEELEPSECKEVLLAIGHYAMDDKLPKLTGMSKIVFSLIKPQIDANNKRAEDGKKGGAFGHLGGRPKKNPIGVIDENPIGVSSKTPNVNENVNVNVNDIYKRKSKRNSFNNFKENDIDFDDLANKVFKN